MYHDMQAEALAFSTDGSLLAVAYGPVVTLWDPTLNMLKHTLTQPHSHDVVRYASASLLPKLNTFAIVSLF